MKSSKVAQAIVIGAGPAGMMSALQLAQRGFQVMIAEKQHQMGTKLLLSGNGRCNISNTLPMKHWEDKIPRNPKFLHTAFHTFSNQDLIQWLEQHDIQLKEENNGKLFPLSDTSKTIVQVFDHLLKEHKVSLIQQRITQLIFSDDQIKGVRGEDGFEQQVEAVVLATGGKTWPQTGSNGEGYKLAEEAGHKIIVPRPSLAPFTLLRHPFHDLTGTSIEDVSLSLLLPHHKKNPSMRGNIVLTHLGISGPAVLDLSAYLPAEGAKDCKLVIDWLPTFSAEKILDQWKTATSGITMIKWLNGLGLFSQKFCTWFLQEFKTLKALSPSLWPKAERAQALQKLKQYSCVISEPLSLEEGMVTAGGVSTREIHPATMESRKHKGLYFAGEVIDVDGLSGGFNIQIALSTGFLAGLSARIPGR